MRPLNRIHCIALLILLSVMGLLPGRASLAFAAGDRQEDPIAILGITSETKVLVGQLKESRTTKLMGIPFITGALDGHEVVLARCGVGKVNAAVTATLLIEHYHPRGILFTGSAGALRSDLAPGDVVIGAKTAQHDVGTLTAKGLEREPTYSTGDEKQNPLFFPADPKMLTAAQEAATSVTLMPFEFGGEKRTPKVITGVIVTGDVFVADQAANDELHRSMNADAVEEEGAAVAQVCRQQKVAYLAIRSISDNANNQTPANYRRFYALAAENSALLVRAIVARLEN